MQTLIKFFSLFSLVIVPSYAETLKAQLTSSERAIEARVTSKIKRSMTAPVEIGILSCRKMNAEYKKLKELEHGTPAFKSQLKIAQDLSEKCSVDAFVNEKDEVIGFQLINNSAEDVIEQDSTPFESSRTFNFRFNDRVTQDMQLDITDDSGLTGKISHDLLETTIVFIPRKVVPHIEYEDLGECRQKVILPTSEVVIFDSITKKIIEGVLKESPMDLNPSRHHRKFAGIEYTGNGIIVRADRRAGAPEYTYKNSFNVNEQKDKALISHKGKKCYVAKTLLWENSTDHDNLVYFKYPSDQQFLDEVVNPKCGWDLSLSDIE
jgi:hypothetical protein